MCRFHEWPEEALLSVSGRFVKDIELLPDELRESVSQFMAFAHRSVNETSAQYLINERRYNYTTPKSFLEFITIYGAAPISLTYESKCPLREIFPDEIFDAYFIFTGTAI